jgi:hypothetical protein
MDSGRINGYGSSGIKEPSWPSDEDKRRFRNYHE